MKYVLPPMHTLRAFEALGRLRNFSHVAEELHLTASAVSHQIAALESFCTTKLFQRNRRDIVLTPAGERLLSVVRDSLEQLSTLASSLRIRSGDDLSITAPPSFVSRWLMSRLGVFMSRHPQIKLKLHATPALVDLDGQATDFGIRYGSGAWSGTRSEKLFDEELFPVASPDYVSRMKLQRLTDLHRCVLLCDDFASWENWFVQAGIKVDSLSHGPAFSDSALLLQAAEMGQGVALARSLLVADTLASGALVRIGTQAMHASNSYYLVSSLTRPDTTAAAAFRLWVSEVVKG
jgi:LysR family transcriptional regulator, glycine cleavage system transcriptional activator